MTRTEEEEEEEDDDDELNANRKISRDAGFFRLVGFVHKLIE